MSKNPPLLNRALHAHIRAHTRTGSICAEYARYECLKTQWIMQNPDATPAEYDRAMHAIAKDCGV